MSAYLIAVIVSILLIGLGIILIIVFRTRSEADPVERQGLNTMRGSKMGSGIAIGAGIGVALGVALDNMAIGIAVGVSIGAAIGAAWARNNDSGQVDAAGSTRQSPPMVWALLIGVVLLLLLGVVFFMLVK